MTRNEIRNKMKEERIKHYLFGASYITKDGLVAYGTTNVRHCLYTDQDFEKEISRLEREHYNFFDVIHIN